MTYEYQILYKDHKGNPQSFMLFADSDADAILKGQKAGMNVVDATCVRPVVDWSKPTFSVEEAGIYCGYQRTAWYSLTLDGRINYVQDGKGQKRFRKVDLDAYLRRHLFVNNQPALPEAA